MSTINYFEQIINLIQAFIKNHRKYTQEFLSNNRFINIIKNKNIYTLQIHVGVFKKRAFKLRFTNIAHV